MVRLGNRRLPDALVVAAHYAAWLGVSAALLWLLLGSHLSLFLTAR